MIYDILDNIKKHPISFMIGVVILLSPIPPSMDYWNEHPKQIICLKQDNTCKMNTYAYKHEICWYTLWRRYKRCSLPKYKYSEMDLISLYDIQDVIVKKENKFYKVYLTGKNDNKSYIAQFKDEKSATYIASALRVRIKKWQEQTSVLDNEEINSYSYEFTE